jgi:hypothetical protein
MRDSELKILFLICMCIIMHAGRPIPSGSAARTRPIPMPPPAAGACAVMRPLPRDRCSGRDGAHRDGGAAALLHA